MLQRTGPRVASSGRESDDIAARAAHSARGDRISVTNSLAALSPHCRRVAPDQERRPSHRTEHSTRLRRAWWRCPRAGPRVGSNAGHRTNAERMPMPGQRLVTNSLAHASSRDRSRMASDQERCSHSGRGGSPACSKRRLVELPKNPDHAWQTNGQHHRTGDESGGCPFCNRDGRSRPSACSSSSFKDHLETFTPAELYLLFQQNGLLNTQGQGKEHSSRRSRRAVSRGRARQVSSRRAVAC